MQELKKRKRRELCNENGIDDTDNECVLAERWGNALNSKTCAEDELNEQDKAQALKRREKNKSIGIWFPYHRVTVVTTIKGKMLFSMGVNGDGELCLLAEETLYLAENGFLKIFCATKNFKLDSFGNAKQLLIHHDKTPVVNTDTIAGSYSCSQLKLLLSTSELYSTFISIVSGLSLHCYLTYRTLRERKYIVRRMIKHLGFDGCNDPYRIHISKTPLPSLPVHEPRKFFDIEIVAFETFAWTSNFSKKRCGEPEDRVVVVQAEHETPSLLALHRLASLHSSSSSSTTTLSSLLPPSSSLSSTSITSSSAVPGLYISMVDEEGAVSLLKIDATRSIMPTAKRTQKRKPQNIGLATKQDTEQVKASGGHSATE